MKKWYFSGCYHNIVRFFRYSSKHFYSVNSVGNLCWFMGFVMVDYFFRILSWQRRLNASIVSSPALPTWVDENLRFRALFLSLLPWEQVATTCRYLILTKYDLRGLIYVETWELIQLSSTRPSDSKTVQSFQRNPAQGVRWFSLSSFLSKITFPLKGIVHEIMGDLLKVRSLLSWVHFTNVWFISSWH